MAETSKDPNLIHEEHRPRDVSAIARLRKQFAVAITKFIRAVQLSAILGVFMVACLLFLDLPARIFDIFTSGNSAIMPSNWLSQGEAFMPLSVFYLILVARRHGGEVATQVAWLSWVMAILILSVLLIYMAPELNADDYPDMRFVAGLAGSWLLGQLVAVSIYDVTRGGKWWRSPLYGALFGFAVQTAVYFFVIYFETTAPWLNWMVADFCIKAVMAVAFLAVYYPLRRSVRAYLGENRV
jgi:hypothetical protein